MTRSPPTVLLQAADVQGSDQAQAEGPLLISVETCCGMGVQDTGQTFSPAFVMSFKPTPFSAFVFRL